MDRRVSVVLKLSFVTTATLWASTSVRGAWSEKRQPYLGAQGGGERSRLAFSQRREKLWHFAAGETTSALFLLAQQESGKECVLVSRRDA